MSIYKKVWIYTFNIYTHTIIHIYMNCYSVISPPHRWPAKTIYHIRTFKAATVYCNGTKHQHLPLDEAILFHFMIYYYITNFMIQ